MTPYHSETEANLREEIDSFHREKDKIQEMIGKIGGTGNRKKAKITNVIFLIVALSVVLLNHLFEGFDPLYAIEIGVLLVSIKIIMLIESLSKMSHFNFWILSSLEYRINAIARDIEKLSRQLEDSEKS